MVTSIVNISPYPIFFSILLLAEGRTAYLGPRADAIQYFDRSGAFILTVVSHQEKLTWKTDSSK